jgi:hypothetical protein
LAGATGEWTTARGCQARRPGIQFGTVSHGERHVVQADTCLVEHVLPAVSMLGQTQSGLQAVVVEEHLSARSVRCLELADSPEAEHLDIPRRARVNVANREAEVVDTPDHAAHGSELPPTTDTTTAPAAVERARHFYFQRKWTKTRPKLSESFSTRW